MSLLDVSIVAVALPSLREGLGASPAAVQWVVSGYALTFGLALVPAGRLGDAYGRRRLFLVALTGFVVCSAAAGAAPSIELLVAARLAQGLAAGTLAPQNSALIQQLFRGEERGRAFGFFGATVGISTAAGPVLGGAHPRPRRRPRRLALDLLRQRADRDRSRWCSPPACCRAATTRTRGHIDLVGVALLGGGVLSLMLPLVEAESGGLRRLWWLFPVGAVLIAAFVWWERRVVRRGGDPLLDLRLVTADSRATPRGPRWAPCTSSGSLGSGSCSPCSSRPGWARPRCSPGSRSPRSRSARPCRRCSGDGSSSASGAA